MIFNDQKETIKRAIIDVYEDGGELIANIPVTHDYNAVVDEDIGKVTQEMRETAARDLAAYFGYDDDWEPYMEQIDVIISSLKLEAE